MHLEINRLELTHLDGALDNHIDLICDDQHDGADHTEAIRVLSALQERVRNLMTQTGDDNV